MEYLSSGKPEYMAKHLRFSCRKIKDNAQKDAKDVMHKRDARKKRKSSEMDCEQVCSARCRG